MADVPIKAGKLLPRERRFLREYMVDFNGTQAALRAGFTGKRPEVAASRMLAKPTVRAELQRRQDQIAARLEVTVERVLKEQAAIAFSDPRRMFNADGTLKPIHELDDASAAALAGIETEALFEGSGADRTHVGTLSKIKRWDKGKALEHLSKFLGIIKDQEPPAAVGPGLTVIVQTSAGQAAVQAAPGAQGRVVVDLPGPG